MASNSFTVTCDAVLIARPQAAETLARTSMGLLLAFESPDEPAMDLNGEHRRVMQERTTADGTERELRERRARGDDRRRTTLRTFIQSGFTPRRRVGRRADEQHLPIDWHEPYLLFLAIMILLLNVADAFLTLTLLTVGAREANPLIAFVLEEYPKLFAITKMGLTGVGVLVLVAVARARLFNVVRVGSLLHAVLAGYIALIAYEWWLLHSIL
jgi:hypothetical protein